MSAETFTWSPEDRARFLAAWETMDDDALNRAFSDIEIRYRSKVLAGARSAEPAESLFAAKGALEEGDPDGAANDLDRVPAGDPLRESAMWRVLRAMAHVQCEEPEPALELFEAAMAEAPPAVAGHCRLNLAGLRHGLGDRERAMAALGPLLAPPGNEFTLEAFALLLEWAYEEKAPRDRVIELLAHIDGLLGKGFRLTRGRNALRLGELMTLNKVEGIQETLYRAHEDAIRRLSDLTPEEIEFCIEEGERTRVGALVEAGAASFLATPALRLTRLEPEGAAYQFAMHECWDAAVALYERHWTRKALLRGESPWPMYVSALYYARRWKATLEALQERRSELARAKFGPAFQLYRAVCEHELGRTKEALATFRKIDDDTWANDSEYPEAFAAFGAFRETGNAAEGFGLVRRALTKDWGRSGPYGLQLVGAIVSTALSLDDRETFAAAARVLIESLGAERSAGHCASLLRLLLSWCDADSLRALQALATEFGVDVPGLDSAIPMADGKFGDAAAILEAELQGGGAPYGNRLRLVQCLLWQGRWAQGRELLVALVEDPENREPLVSLELLAALDEREAPGSGAEWRARADRAEAIIEASDRGRGPALRDAARAFAADTFPALARERLAKAERFEPTGLEARRLQRRLAWMQGRGIE